MENEKAAFAMAPNRVSLTANAIDDKLALLAAGAAVLVLLLFAFMDTAAFADNSATLHQRSIAESMAVTTSHGSSPSSPASYQRSMSESLSVTANYGKAPNSYSRSMSEQASLTTGMPASSAPAGPQLRAPAAQYSAGSNQRVDERTSLRNVAGRADSLSKSTAEMPYSEPVLAGGLTGGDAGMIVQSAASVDDGASDEPGDHSLRYVLAEMGAAEYGAGYSYATNVVFGMQGFAVVAIALSRSAAARRVARASNVRILVAVFSSPSERLRRRQGCW